VTRARLRLPVAVAAAVAAVGCSDHGSVEKFCTQIEVVPELAAAFDAGELDAAVEQLDDLHDVAPDEVRDDVGLLADVAERLAAALANPDSDASAGQLFELAPDLEAAAEASSRVAAYTKTECGIDLNPPTPGP
jgi:hypothetical protein